MEGTDYYFVSKEEFDKIDFLETDEYAGNFYGLSTVETESKLKDGPCFAVVSQEGRRQILEKYPSAKTIFVTAEIEHLEQRLKERSRGENIRERLQNAVVNGEFIPPKGVNCVIRNYDLDFSKRMISGFVKEWSYGQL